jgi:hypothetical protein
MPVAEPDDEQVAQGSSLPRVGSASHFDMPVLLGLKGDLLMGWAPYFLLTKVWRANIVGTSECSFTIVFFMLSALCHGVDGDGLTA